MTHVQPRNSAGIYRYDEFDRQFVRERVEQFRFQVERRLRGELSEDEFKPLRLMNGLYLQLHAYMLRIAIPYGTFTAHQMRGLAAITRRYDKGYGHFSTRQNLQLHWIKLEDTPDILGALADIDMHSIQTSGNCVRNVTTDQFAGATPEEVVDPRIYAEVLRQWTTIHPEFSFLPRKFKIAITGSPKDRAAVRIHDIGLVAKRNAEGRIGFEVYVGGGLGRTPFVAPKTRDWVDEEDLIAYIEAVLRVYNQAGRRDNAFKARIKILVHETKLDKFIELVEDEFARVRGPKFRLEPELVAAIATHFAPPPFEWLPAVSEPYVRRRGEDAAFAAWTRTSVHPHKAPGYASITISLKSPGAVPGDISSEQMETVADLADRYGFGEIRVTHEQNLVLPHVRQDELFALWQALSAVGLATANIGLIGDIIACPGLDYCSLANARSIPIAQALSKRFADTGRQGEIGDLRIKISGCINACGHHHVGAIGILGVDKKGEEFYQLTLGGNAELDASLGDIIGPALKADEAVEAIDRIVELYLERRQPGERFLATLARIGHAPFKETAYAAD